MIKVDLSEVRRILSDDSKSITSFNNLLELKFLSSAVIERWMLAQDIDEVCDCEFSILCLVCLFLRIRIIYHAFLDRVSYRGGHEGVP